jgi:hypothetical protein
MLHFFFALNVLAKQAIAFILREPFLSTSIYEAKDPIVRSFKTIYPIVNGKSDSFLPMTFRTNKTESITHSQVIST